MVCKVLVMKSKMAYAIPFFVFFLACEAFAMDIRIDFSLGSGAAGNNWNSLSASNLKAGTTSLIDHDTGASTGVTVTGTGFDTDYIGSISTLPTWWDGGTQAQDRIYFYDNGPQTGSITLAGLSISQAYKLEVFSAGDFAERVISANSTFGVNSRTGLVDSAWHGITDGTAGWLTWDNLTPTVGGTVDITFDSLSANYVPVNALRITNVPEPTALSLMGLGLIFCLGRRRTV